MGSQLILNTACVEGELVSLSEANLPFNHPVFLTGFGVYESIQIDQGRPFYLNAHIERLLISASLLQIQIPQSFADLMAWAHKLVAALPPETYSLQILLFGPKTSRDGPLTVMYPKPIPTYPAAYFSEGAKAITFTGERLLPACKSMNTLVNYLARNTAQQQEALEAIFTAAGKLFEGARSNLFVVHKETGQLLTPPTGQVLAGVTRDVLIEVMETSLYPVREAEVSVDTPISEMFITSTSMHVMPITNLNGTAVGNGQVGPVTQAAQAAFEAHYQTTLSSSRKITTPSI